MAKYIYNKYNSILEYFWKKYEVNTTSTFYLSNYTSENVVRGGSSSYYLNPTTGLLEGRGSIYSYPKDVGVTVYSINKDGKWMMRAKIAEAPGLVENFRVKQKIDKSKGSYIEQVSSVNSTEYPTNGQSGSYWYDTRTSSYSRGDYIGEVTAEDGTYPVDGRASDGYWYVRQGLANTAPLIDGFSGSSSTDLGTKTSNFNVEYTVTDVEGGVLKVDIYEDSTKVVSDRTVSLGYKNSYSVDLAKFSLGSHSVKVVAKDADGASSERTYSFYKSNTAPVISGEDKDLGDKNTSFTQEFTVTDADRDTVSALVTLNGVEIMNIANAIGQSHIINITQEILGELPLGEVNNLVIKADDGKTGVTYRRYTFTRVNKAPIISGSNRDIGEINSANQLDDSFTATDLEGDAITAQVFLNDILIKDFETVEDNAVNEYKVPQMEYIKLKKGQHTVRIVASDDKGEQSERIITFTKKALKLEMIVEVNDTDVLAKKILAILNMTKADGDILSVKATNNYNDETPVWEDITSKSVAKMVHQYENMTKTATMGKIALWITVTKASDESQRSVIRGLSGGYE